MTENYKHVLIDETYSKSLFPNRQSLIKIFFVFFFSSWNKLKFCPGKFSPGFVCLIFFHPSEKMKNLIFYCIPTAIYDGFLWYHHTSGISLKTTDRFKHYLSNDSSYGYSPFLFRSCFKIFSVSRKTSMRACKHNAITGFQISNLSKSFRWDYNTFHLRLLRSTRPSICRE